MLIKIKYYLRVLGFRGLLSLIRAKLTKSEICHSLDKYDCAHPFSIRIPSSDIPTTEQIFVDLEYDFLAKDEPSVIVDAGANIGLASIYFANKYKQAKIIAIEPEKSNFELLKKNTAPYPNIIPVHAALWDKNEEINLIDPGLGNWGFMTENDQPEENAPSNACHRVAAMTVDRIISDYDLEKIDILKIDIEGAEKEVFSDSSAWIDKVDSIIVELHERMKPGCNRSFYCGTNGFDNEWHQGENVYLSRGNFLSKK